MKNPISHIKAAVLLLIFAAISTITISCNKKDACAECAEERAQDTTMVDNTTTAEDTEAIEGSMTSPANANIDNSTSTSKTTAKRTNNKNASEETEDDSNVSIIDPNQKSNTDSKRTYGSTGTSGGSGTSGSGGDGNGSTGWNANKEKN